MKTTQDKVLGSWFGMAVGDAMGSTARGLKPATIAQCFRVMDGYKDVRPFLGRGVRHYRMQGLYGWQTQMALVVCDTLLQHKGIDLPEAAGRFQELSQGGPETYFGVYRNPDAWFRKTAEELSRRDDLTRADANVCNGAYLALAVPIALYYRGRPGVIRERCLDLGILLTRNPVELMGVALTAFLINRFLPLEIGPEEAPATALEGVLPAAAAFCREIRAGLQTRLGNDMQDKESLALDGVFSLLEENLGRVELPELARLICRYASDFTRQPVSHAAQGYTLTLLPLAVATLLQAGNGFAPVLTSVLNRGGEADRLGAVTGALAGALYGFARIPRDWRTGLVNAGEIKSRGEALFAKRRSPALKDLYEMESGLTLKECEGKRKYAIRKPRAPARKVPPPVLASVSEEIAVSKKDDPAQWRKYQKDKTKKKRDRRKNMGEPFS
ncbi:MAG: ADP-ribosylglycohydrolase family protein [Nitrospinales bacterium]